MTKSFKEYQKTFQLQNYHYTQLELPIRLTCLDIDKDYNIRIRAEVANPQANEFTAKIWTWFDTKLYSAGLDELDYNSDYNLRLRLETPDVTQTGFKWDLDVFDSEMYQSGASYFACDNSALS
ncbi:hypothetical protein N7478_012026 [Penicillium angulare]|uniref:uncharacterized protein n=1 Tax=Penicillium angulare TaxID=116970 RepID=UPI0025415E1B|nr:uncharacterized protein N7478_012026 [Penicillium angulare]KAJ5261431.1 hypothetical protein N7478_012026 [Penicillium angulare]